MEEILFDGYRKFQKEIRGNAIKAVLALPIPAILILVTTFASMISSLVLYFVKDLQWLSLIFFGMEAGMCVVSYFYTEHYRIKTSNARLVTYQGYCGKVYTWLNGTGMVVSSDNIHEIMERVENWIERLETRRKKSEERIWHIVNILLIPLFLAVFSAWMTNKSDLAELIAAAVAMVMVFGTLGLLCYQFYSVFSFFQKRKIEQMRCFAEDLQGVLDTQFDSKLIAVLPALKEEVPADAHVRTKPEKKKPKQIENAGKPWTAEDDALLCQMFAAGHSGKEMCDCLKRSRGAIAARLVRIGKIKERSDFRTR